MLRFYRNFVNAVSYFEIKLVRHLLNNLGYYLA